MILLIIALLSFVGSHLLLSHPLRGPVLAAVGPRGFAGVYSLVAFATFGWAIWAFGRAPAGLYLWTAPESWAYAAAAPFMLLASILLVGSVTAPNPALMGGKASPQPMGVMRITRHPMMWAFAIWAAVHATISGDSRTVALCVAIGGLALVGAAGQDRKKRGQMGAAWDAHEAQTSFVPFARGRFNPGAIAAIGGVVLFAIATWAHPYLGGPALWQRIIAA